MRIIYKVCIMVVDTPYNVVCIFRATSTRAKSCDHVNVRAQKKVSKGRPETLPKSRSVVTDFQV
jgi:hypothetical protein